MKRHRNTKRDNFGNLAVVTSILSIPSWNVFFYISLEAPVNGYRSTNCMGSAVVQKMSAVFRCGPWKCLNCYPNGWVEWKHPFWSFKNWSKKVCLEHEIQFTWKWLCWCSICLFFRQKKWGTTYPAIDSWRCCGTSQRSESPDWFWWFQSRTVSEFADLLYIGGGSQLPILIRCCFCYMCVKTCFVVLLTGMHI